MKICFITTWLPKCCGIATYTNFLCEKLLTNKNIKIDIITEKENPRVINKNIKVHPTFDRNTDYSNDIIAKIKQVKPDIVHIQHEFEIFGYDFRLMKLLKKIKTRKVITLHTIAVNGQKTRFPNIEDFNAAAGKLADKIIMHQESNKNIMERQGIQKGKIAIITHGTKLMQKLRQEEARRRLGLKKDIRILLLFGFLRKSKLLDFFIDALPTIFKKNPKTYLYFVGSKKQLIPKDKEFFRFVKRKIKKLKIDNRIIFVNKFIPEAEVNLYYNSADVVVLPYDLKDWGASGVSHLALGSGKPIIVSRIAKFDEIRKNVSEEITVLPHQTEEWIRVVNRALNDKLFRNYIVNKTKAYAKKTSWDNIAKQHFKLYKSLIKIKI